MSVGKDLLDVPFDAMVYSLATAIAKGQTNLDRASLATLKALSHQTFSWIPEVTETLTPAPRIVNGVTVTGVAVGFEPAAPVNITLLQAGIFPTFYQFTESVIEVKMSISQKTSSSSSFEVSSTFDASETVGGSVGFLFGSANFTETVSYSSSVDYKTSNTYSYSAEGSSSLKTTLRPVPPPARVMPRFCTVSLLKAGSPEVTWA